MTFNDELSRRDRPLNFFTNVAEYRFYICLFIDRGSGSSIVIEFNICKYCQSIVIIEVLGKFF